MDALDGEARGGRVDHREGIGAEFIRIHAEERDARVVGAGLEAWLAGVVAGEDDENATSGGGVGQARRDRDFDALGGGRWGQTGDDRGCSVDPD